ncbi:MAG TPA: PHB depolymerase family esterase [Polyangiaceae bacterium]|nr:PHB depolymerase family esterase [Polyangiaceae bacterium]
MVRWSRLVWFVSGIFMGSAGPTEAAPRAAPRSPEASSWCAPETETLADDVCYFDGAEGARRTLVVFLHGVIPPNTTWQWTQHHALVHEAKRLGFAVLMPRAPRRTFDKGDLYAWPTAVSAQRTEEEALVESWSRARKLVTSRAGLPFDEVFVVGFSSGAYYAASLALRGRLDDVDGYALLAGGADYGRPSAKAKKPIYVGVSARDRQTAPDARALAADLAKWGWPHRVHEEPVGHTVSDVQMTPALAYLRHVTSS